MKKRYKVILTFLLALILVCSVIFVTSLRNQTYEIKNIEENKWAFQVVGAWNLNVTYPCININRIKIGIIDTYPPDIAQIKTIGNPKTYDDHGVMVSSLIASILHTNGKSDIPIYFFPIAKDDFNVNALAKEIEKASNMKIDVLNISLGSFNNDEKLHNVIRDATRKGMIIVASAGNSGSDAYNYPASYPEVISVGALGKNLNVLNSSNSNNAVAFYAPGDDIIIKNSSQTLDFSGTSASTPFVTGLITLMKLSKSDLTGEEIKKIIDNSSSKYSGLWNGSNVYVKLINYKKALGVIN